jgi:hypothetical protein
MSKSKEIKITYGRKRLRRPSDTAAVRRFILHPSSLILHPKET